ncbi:MAG: hypothetical protein M1438_02125 [Deltaproteobacteria bacterium]|nr:hypothetical protein [Deltaproteobacteria bacterium]
MARNRYGWEKRAKEMARKQKHDEKVKRRQQGKTATPTEEDVPEVVEELNPNENDSAAPSARQD